jgi:hypothetical protein
MGSVRVDYFHARSSEGGRPHLCWLRTASVEPWGISIIYVLAHTRFMGSWKISSFDGHWVGEYSTIALGRIRDSVWATHRCPLRYCVEDMHYSKVAPTRLLIVIMNCGHLWCLCESCVLCCQVFRLQGCKLVWISATPSKIGDGLIAVFKPSKSTSLCIVNYMGDVDYFVVMAW